MTVQAGLTDPPGCSSWRARAGCCFPPDPGAAEQSQIGGNVATNAGGPHAFKYGVTGAWVIGLEAVIPPGEPIRSAARCARTSPATTSCTCSSARRGRSGIVTAAWLRLMPAPEAAFPVVAVLEDARQRLPGARGGARKRPAGGGVEYFDDRSWAIAAPRPSRPRSPPAPASWCWPRPTAAPRRPRAAASCCARRSAEHALTCTRRPTGAEIAELWRWREGVSFLVDAHLGGKLSEDIAVPLDRLFEAVARTRRDRRPARPRLRAPSATPATGTCTRACSSTAATTRRPAAAPRRRPRTCSRWRSSSAARSRGEHGLGTLKNGRLGHQWNPAAVRLHEARQAHVRSRRT